MALRDQPYLPLYVQDFLTDEKLAECSAQSTGVYIRIMCLMHKSEEYGTILLKQRHKQTSEQIKNFALLLLKHLPYELDVIHSSLTELVEEGVLIIEGDLLIQKRMVKDANISISRAVSGQKGGNNSLGKKPKTDKNFAQAKTQANSESEYENDIEIEFETFWNVYDKKVGNKEKLLNKWKKLKEVEKDKIWQTVRNYVLSTEKKFRKNPETYLNNKAWEDEIIEPQPKKQVGTTQDDIYRILENKKNKLLNASN